MTSVYNILRLCWQCSALDTWVFFTARHRKWESEVKKIKYRKSLSKLDYLFSTYILFYYTGKTKAVWTSNAKEDGVKHDQGWEQYITHVLVLHKILPQELIILQTHIKQWSLGEIKQNFMKVQGGSGESLKICDTKTCVHVTVHWDNNCSLRKQTNTLN